MRHNREFIMGMFRGITIDSIDFPGLERDRAYSYFEDKEYQLGIDFIREVCGYQCCVFNSREQFFALGFTTAIYELVCEDYMHKLRNYVLTKHNRHSYTKENEDEFYNGYEFGLEYFYHEVTNEY